LEVSQLGNELRWQVAPGDQTRAKTLLIESTDPQAICRVFVTSDSRPAPELVFLGPEREPARSLPLELSPTFASLPPSEAGRFQPLTPGLTLLRYASESTPGRETQVAPLDQETIRQLRSLGYLK